MCWNETSLRRRLDSATGSILSGAELRAHHSFRRTFEDFMNTSSKTPVATLHPDEQKRVMSYAQSVVSKSPQKSSEAMATFDTRTVSSAGKRGVVKLLHANTLVGKIRLSRAKFTGVEEWIRACCECCNELNDHLTMLVALEVAMLLQAQCPRTGETQRPIFGLHNMPFWRSKPFWISAIQLASANTMSLWTLLSTGMEIESFGVII